MAATEGPDDDLGDFMLGDGNQEELNENDNASEGEAGGYCPSEVPEEDYEQHERNTPPSTCSYPEEPAVPQRGLFSSLSQKAFSTKQNPKVTAAVSPSPSPLFSFLISSR
jgi:hypothetical protein